MSWQRTVHSHKVAEWRMRSKGTNKISIHYRRTRRKKVARTSPVEEVRAILAREREALRELAHELDDLRDVVVVLAVPRAGRGVEEVVAPGDEFEDLPEPSGRDQRCDRERARHTAAQHASDATRHKRAPTMHATLQMSALGPHFAPRMTSGQRYCRVWMSSVKWCSTHVAGTHMHVSAPTPTITPRAR